MKVKSPSLFVFLQPYLHLIKKNPIHHNLYKHFTSALKGGPVVMMVLPVKMHKLALTLNGNLFVRNFVFPARDVGYLLVLLSFFVKCGQFWICKEGAFVLVYQGFFCSGKVVVAAFPSLLAIPSPFFRSRCTVRSLFTCYFLPEIFCLTTEYYLINFTFFIVSYC